MSSEPSENAGNGESKGGLGGFDGEIGVRDARMIERVLKSRVPISDETREKAANLLDRLLTKLGDEEDPGYREANSTLQSLARLDRLNLEARREGLDIALQERKIEAEQQRSETPQQVNVHMSGSLKIVEDGDWYGNESRISPSANGSSDPDPDGPGPIQGNGLRA